MGKKQRKQPTLKERLTPCAVCLHPLSQRHHLLSFSVHGEKGAGTVQLCANCHDLYHLFERYGRRGHNETDSLLFDVETQEEKLIRTIGARPEYSPLVRLAGIVALFERLLSQPLDFSSYSEDDRKKVIDCLNFIANFPDYVEQERKKRDEWYRANAHLFFDLFGGNVERLESDEQ